MSDLKPEDRALIERTRPEEAYDHRTSDRVGRFYQIEEPHLKAIIDAARAEGLRSPSGGGEGEEGFIPGPSSSTEKATQAPYPALPQAVVNLVIAAREVDAATDDMEFGGRALRAFDELGDALRQFSHVAPFDGGEAVHGQVERDRPRDEPKDSLSGPTGEVGGVAEGWVLVPREPPVELLVSMAVRQDHGLGVPGYYDQPIFGAENVGHARQMESALSDMRKLYEEVVGDGFYAPERAERYRAMIAAAPPTGGE